MREILLENGGVTRVDDEDYGFLTQFGWHRHKTRWNNYVRRHRPTPIYIHRLLLSSPEGVLVDHRDGDGLNNQRSNLRLATPLQNSQNYRRSREGCTSQYKGVCWAKTTSNWKAQIKVNGKSLTLGYFDSELEAALAYNEAALKYHGEFACPNDTR